MADDATADAKRNSRRTTRRMTQEQIDLENFKLVEAVSCRNIDQVREMLGRGVSPNGRDTSGVPVLFTATALQDVPILRELLKRRADVNAKEESVGATPLVLASFRGHRETVIVLLQHGARANHACSDRASALYLAAAAGHREVVTALLRGRADPNMLCNDGGRKSTPLTAAVRLRTRLNNIE